MDEPKVITCKICNKTGMKRIGFHLRRMHQMSLAQYAAFVPNETKTEPNPQPIVREVTAKTVLAFLKGIFNKIRSSRLWAAQR